MSDVKRYVRKSKKRDPEFSEGYDIGYEEFKIGVILKEARQETGLTQEQLAKKLKTQKTAISRIENHAEDIRLSILENFAAALGKKLYIAVR